MISDHISQIHNLFKKNNHLLIQMINSINFSQTKINKSIEKDMIGFFLKINSGNFLIYLIKQHNLLKHAQYVFGNFHNNLSK